MWWFVFVREGFKCWCDIFSKLKWEIWLIWMWVWLICIVLCRWFFILCWWWIGVILMKLIIIRLLRLCRCNWCVILFVVFRLVLRVVFLILLFLVVWVELMLMEVKVLVGLIMIELLEGRWILCWKVDLIWFLIWKWLNSGILFLYFFIWLMKFGCIKWICLRVCL